MNAKALATAEIFTLVDGALFAPTHAANGSAIGMLVVGNTEPRVCEIDITALQAGKLATASGIDAFTAAINGLSAQYRAWLTMRAKRMYGQLIGEPTSTRASRNANGGSNAVRGTQWQTLLASGNAKPTFAPAPRHASATASATPAVSGKYVPIAPAPAPAATKHASASKRPAATKPAATKRRKVA